MPGKKLTIGADSKRTKSRGTVSYPFVISSQEVSLEQFQAFVSETGCVTDAERGKQPDPATQPDDSINDATGAWKYSENTFIWQEGMSWKARDAQTAENDESSVTRNDDSIATVLSFHDATAFCEWLSEKEHRLYRLPTNDEWTVAMQLQTTGRQKPGGASKTNEEQPAGNPSPPLKISFSKSLFGEWTAKGTSRNPALIRHRDKDDGNVVIDYLEAPPEFRCSEISFRVVTELQSAASLDSESPEQQPPTEAKPSV